MFVRFRPKDMIRLFGSAMIVSLMSGSFANGQRPDLDLGNPRSFPNFKLDWSQFRAADTSLSAVEVYYRVPNSGVSFKTLDSGYEARYELRIDIMDDGYSVDQKEFRKRVFVQDYKRTKLYTDYALNMASFDLEPGDYQIVATLSDLNADRTATKKLKAKVSDFSQSKYPKLSGIEFLYSFKPEGGEEKYFRKGNGVAVPSVDHSVQGGPGGGPVLFYFEIYPGKDAELNVLVDVRIRSRIDGDIYRDTLYVMMDQPVIRQVRNVDLSTFKPGDYEVTVEALPRKGKVVATRSSNFTVSWSLLSMVSDDYETVLQQLYYIASSEERDILKEAETVEDRLAAWREFWEARDPSPGDAVNEARLSFYARLRYANAHFSTPRREGWRTDRGMVLLRYGSPDEAIDEAVPRNSGDYQVWFYYDYDGEPLRFIFVDEFGDLDYRLQFPYDGRF